MTDLFVDPNSNPWPGLGPNLGQGGIDAVTGGVLQSILAGTAAQDSVLRSRTTLGPKPNQVYGAQANAWLSTWPRGGVRDNTASLDDYNAEFFDRWESPEFQRWLTSRMAAMGARDLSTPSAYAFWVDMGEQTSKARGQSWTPEQYIEYMANGGLKKDLDVIEAEMAAGEPLYDENGEPMVASPIQTTTSSRTYDMNPMAANTSIDKMSMALLGRMATNSEKKRLRGVINGILKSNPDVSTETVDSTDPDSVVRSVVEDAGMTAEEAVAAVEVNMLRSSEGQAFNAGKLIEEAMRGL